MHWYATCYRAWRTTWRKLRGVGRKKTCYMPIEFVDLVQCVLRPRRGLGQIAGFGNTGSLSSTEQKGKIVIQVQGLVLASFLAPEIDMFFEDRVVVLVAQLVSRHSCVADRLAVVVRFPAGPRVRLKTADPPKGNGLGQKKCFLKTELGPPLLFVSCTSVWIDLAKAKRRWTQKKRFWCRQTCCNSDYKSRTFTTCHGFSIAGWRWQHSASICRLKRGHMLGLQHHLRLRT